VAVDGPGAFCYNLINIVDFYMHAENWRTQYLQLEGWLVRLTSYQIGQSYIAEVESSDSGAIIVRATGKTQEQVQCEAIETATRRLLRTRHIDPRLTVGG
jgi:hypothetical protein